MRKAEKFANRLEKLSSAKCVLIGGDDAQAIAVCLRELSALAEAAETRLAEATKALAAIRRRTIFGPDITTGVLLDLTACVAPVAPEDKP